MTVPETLAIRQCLRRLGWPEDTIGDKLDALRELWRAGKESGR